MAGLILAFVFWQLFKMSPETPAKKRRYDLSTNFSRRR